MPRRSTSGSTGLDLYARLNVPLQLNGTPQRVTTGIALEVPLGYDVQVRPRSSLSSRGVMAAFGTIDADYRGELLVTMWTFGDLDRYELRDGDRIAQLVIAMHAPAVVVEVTELSGTERGDSGHGSTGR